MQPAPDAIREYVDTVPGLDGLTTAVELIDHLDEILLRRRQLNAHVESVSGLRLGQLRVLYALAEGVGVDQIASTLGEHADAAEATLRSLREAGLVADQHGDLAVTDAGQVVVDQITALGVRRVAALIDS